MKTKSKRQRSDPDLGDCIVLNEETVTNAYGTDVASDLDNRPWDVEEYCQNIIVKVQRVPKNLDEALEFDIINIDAPLANALRRVLIAEVPTVAIEKVHISQNTSIIQDEIVAHRLGLIPLNVDPRVFEYRTEESEAKGDNTIILQLNVQCSKKRPQDPEAAVPEQMYDNVNVYSSDLKWVPVDEEQKQKFSESPIGSVQDDILLAKLRPPQAIELVCYGWKGIGRDHAKFSPVATASYRLLPEIHMTREVFGEEAERFQKCFSDGVIDLEETIDGSKRAVVKDARRDMCSRNLFRHRDLADSAILTRKKRHFIFSIETTGALPAEVLCVEALSVIEKKCATLLQHIDAFL